MATRINIKLKLRGVVSVDFRYGILHHYQALKADGVIEDVKTDECILLRSHTGRRMAFVFKEATIQSAGGDATMVVTALQLALDRMTAWNYLMLQNYAEKCGIELLGIKRFEEHMRELAKEKAAERKAS